LWKVANLESKGYDEIEVKTDEGLTLSRGEIESMAAHELR
jgi:hypothetical protein